MTEGKSGRFWTAVIAACIIFIVAGIIIGLCRYEPGEPVEIHKPQTENWQGMIYIGGAVNLPGYYPYSYDDDIGSLIQAAGGTVNGAGPENLTLRIPEEDENQGNQKININRADTWLLEALPGIGEVLAQRIVEYRQQNGLFRSTNELLQVEGIGTATFEGIEDLVTVAD